MIAQREIWLAPFPFSDQLGMKVRPVVVISNDQFNANSEDILVMGMTSQFSKGKYAVSVSPLDDEEKSLHHQGYIKVENVLKLSQKLVYKKIGRLNKDKFQQAIQLFEMIIH
ncbi:MAG: type II toxin-antitoxin system PemK/MazF family toxin [Candidatus Diapherotrites archaeon]|nr:type II toxin-antitoxin system PemK/MazF family toxin [Candidatus Diapherotrites archaeon]